jgi:glycine/D-amino acid oxidase-like deaminating enzyme
MGYVRGLARAALAAGAGISAGVTARKLTRAGNRWIVDTDRGRVTARNVVLGTNAYTDTLWPGLKKTFTVINYFQVATVPLGEKGKTILPEGQGLWDTGRIMFSLRRDAFGRLIVGSMGRAIGGDRGLSRRWAALGGAAHPQHLSGTGRCGIREIMARPDRHDPGPPAPDIPAGRRALYPHRL